MLRRILNERYRDSDTGSRTEPGRSVQGGFVGFELHMCLGELQAETNRWPSNSARRGGVVVALVGTLAQAAGRV